jgi:DNA (cytosine-5)-methyltransferase 1
MAVKPRLLDLFCGAGGAGMGYHRAGFEVTGVDIEPQPGYPFEFIQADAMTFPLAGFDVIHASPPCQDHSSLSVNGLHGTGWMLNATIERLAAQPAWWVVENVGTARMRGDFVLCGSMFDLNVYRHRKFSIDPRFPALLGVPGHPRHRRAASRQKSQASVLAGAVLTVTGDLAPGFYPYAAQAMGIDWMSGNELSQAIPPAYTGFIGAQLIESLDLSSGPFSAATGCI